MNPSTWFPDPAKPPGSPLGWPRLRLWLLLTVIAAVLRTLSSETAFPVWMVRCGFMVAVGLAGYTLLERWPQRWPAWLPRWIAQLVMVMVLMPPAAYFSYVLTLGTLDVDRLGSGYATGWRLSAFMGVLFGPWIALGAMLRRSEAFAREQAMAFQLQRSELERKALDARLKLTQAQVEPHFLFNTLANVRSLVRKAGSAEATTMLDSLIVYLKAAVPSLDDQATTFASEQHTVQAYLELMHLRFPDRLAYSVTVEPAARPLHCPPLMLLTLVENSIKHGIDPSESGGRVEVSVTLVGDRVRIQVLDTGVGLAAAPRPGTGLANLRERLALSFGEAAWLRLEAVEPQGTRATAECPARTPAGA